MDVTIIKYICISKSIFLYLKFTTYVTFLFYFSGSFNLDNANSRSRANWRDLTTNLTCETDYFLCGLEIFLDGIFDDHDDEKENLKMKSEKLSESQEKETPVITRPQYYLLPYVPTYLPTTPIMFYKQWPIKNDSYDFFIKIFFKQIL